MALTKKQIRFCEEYIIDLNATQAAIRAGYSEKTAEQLGYQLLQKTSVSDYILEVQSKRSERTEITADRVLQELAKIGFANITDFMTVEGGMTFAKSTAEISQEKIGAIAGIKEGANGVEIRLNDKGKALELIGRHLGMWNDKLNVTASIPEKLKEIEEYLDGE